MATPDPPTTASALRDQKQQTVRIHFERKGYRVHSGLQFGCDLVLYADDPQRVHSDFCVYVARTSTVDGGELAGSDAGIDWREIQTLVRMMPDLHKTLLLVRVRDDQIVDEMALSTEHAPFRHKQKHLGKVGSQVKPNAEKRLDEMR